MTEINYDEMSRKIIDEVVKVSFGQFVKKIEIGAEDVAKTVVDALKEKSLHAILETVAFYRSVSKDEGFLFPNGTRFLFNRGQIKIIAIEQPPQVRTILLDESLWGTQKDQRGQIKEFNLAFPYVVFIVVFTEKLENLYVYFRNKPLKSLNSTLCQAVFSNLNDNNSVCLSERTYADSDPLNVKIETSISDFWQSLFNSDLDTRWRERTNIDNRLDLNAWRLQSQSQPMFPCSIDWQKSHSLGKAMELAGIKCPDMLDESDKQVSGKLDRMMGEAADELSLRLKKYLTAERLERFCPSNVKKDLSLIVGGMCGEMETLIRRLVKELSSAKERIERQSTDVSWENQRGGLWG